jgi:hypothetical protein
MNPTCGDLSSVVLVDAFLVRLLTNTTILRGLRVGRESPHDTSELRPGAGRRILGNIA